LIRLRYSLEEMASEETWLEVLEDCGLPAVCLQAAEEDEEEEEEEEEGMEDGDGGMEGEEGGRRRRKGHGDGDGWQWEEVPGAAGDAADGHRRGLAACAAGVKRKETTKKGKNRRREQ